MSKLLISISDELIEYLIEHKCTVISGVFGMCERGGDLGDRSPQWGPGQSPGSWSDWWSKSPRS